MVSTITNFCGTISTSPDTGDNDGDVLNEASNHDHYVEKYEYVVDVAVNSKFSKYGPLWYRVNCFNTFGSFWGIPDSLYPDWETSYYCSASQYSPLNVPSTFKTTHKATTHRLKNSSIVRVWAYPVWLTMSLGMRLCRLNQNHYSLTESKPSLYPLRSSLYRG